MNKYQPQSNFRIYSFAILLCLQQAFATVPPHRHHSPHFPPPPARISQLLAWHANENEGICYGHYDKQPQCPITAPKDPDSIKIKADKSSLFQTGRSTLQGHLAIAQNDQCITMEKATIFREAKSAKLSHIELTGNVQINEPDKLMICDRADIYPLEDRAVLFNTLYRFDLPLAHSIECQNGQCAPYTVWGHAAYFEGTKSVRYELRDATFTTCTPDNTSWQIHARKIIIDQAAGKAQAYNATLHFHHAPVFYLPYYSFSIDKRRKSGFLTPIVGFTSESGLDLGLPFYWNMAPNYDSTITTHYLSERGLMIESEFRYMTPHHQGYFTGTYLPDDKRYQAFLNTNNIPYSDTARSAIHYRDTGYLSPHWTSAININDVSDNYYLQNFAKNIEETTENQLQRRAEIQYTSSEYDFLARVQAYQTLNPINQPLIANIYRQLPHMTFHQYEHPITNYLYFNLHSGFDHFMWPNSTTASTHPDANRMYLAPSITLPLSSNAIYFKPQVELNYTAYYLQKPITGALRNNIHRTLPIFSIDSGVYLDRDFSFHHNNYTQTLIPRIYYLYVPYERQNDIPIFDTGVYTFSFDSLFRHNRFAGIDRIADTHQISYGLTTTLRNENDGMEKLRASIGQAIYLKKTNVSLCSTPGNPNCIDRTNPQNETYSPIAAQVEYDFNRYWLGDGTIAWDPKQNDTVNASFDLHYQPSPHKVINLAYTYSRNNFDPFSQMRTETSLDQVDLSTAWPASQHWSTLAAWSYNLQNQHPQDYFLGLEYTSCCWAVRLMAERAFNRFASNNDPIFYTRFYIQLLLKGLGTITPYDPSTIIAEHIPGLQDIF